MFRFKKPKNELELGLIDSSTKAPSVPNEIYIVCPSCKCKILSSDLNENMKTCPKCEHHFKMSARQIIASITDDGSFSELFGELETKNILEFPDYDRKLKSSMLDTKEKEAVTTGICTICGQDAAIFVMDGAFMMGSMGCVVGE